MCTLSWLHSGDGYQVLCNRDEKKTRSIASPPRVRERDGVRFIAPEDGDFGGAWIAVNEFGVTVALLNGPQPMSSRARQSRGLLVLNLIPARSLPELYDHLLRTPLEEFAPFSLAAFEPGRPTFLATWNGRGLRIETDAEHLMPLTSSSVDPEGVRERRLHEFRKLVHEAGQLDAEALFRFHFGHGGAPSAYSTCMHRPDACTASFSWVDVSTREARFFYTPGAPCAWAGGDTVVLPLAGAVFEESVACLRSY